MEKQLRSGLRSCFAERNQPDSGGPERDSRQLRKDLPVFCRNSLQPYHFRAAGSTQKRKDGRSFLFAYPRNRGRDYTLRYRSITTAEARYIRAEYTRAMPARISSRVSMAPARN